MFKKGFGPGSYPNLIVCNNSSLVKINGMPYSAPMTDDRWLFYASYSRDPLLLLLELIWTRISYLYGISSDIFGEDLTIDIFRAFMWGKCVKENNLFGWECGIFEAEEKVFEETTLSIDWEPEFLDIAQVIIIEELIQNEVVDISENEFAKFLEPYGYTVDAFLDSLISKNLVSLNGKELSLLTDNCVVAILPDGSYVAGEDKSGRFSRWLAKHLENWNN